MWYTLFQKEGDYMPVSEKQKGYRDKYDKENYQYITFKAKKGAKERIVAAATATNQSTNHGFSWYKSTLKKYATE